MRVADYVFNYLADHGIKDVFMVSGGGAMFLNDGLGKEQRIRYICNHHEQACAIAAEGYARTTGQLAVVSVTTGPGGTNTLTGVIGQWLDSIPVLYLSGQVKYSTTIDSCPHLELRQLGDQEINIVDIVKPVTKYALTVTDPLQIRFELEKAIALALSGRKGPVWLDIPINVQSMEIDPSTLQGYVPPVEENTCSLSSNRASLQEIAALLLKARAPVIIAGHGIRLSEGIAQFKELVERINCPVLSTFGGFDLIPTEHPCSIGRIGTIGTRAGNIALQNADFILCLGSRNNIRQISYNWENFAKKAQTFVMVDIDPAELKKPTLRVTHPVCMDIRTFLTGLLELLPTQEPARWPHWLAWLIERKQRYPTVLPEYHHVAKGVQPYVFTETLTRLLPETTTLTCTNATPSIALFQAGIIKKGQRLFANSGCAAMGYGLPASIGAACACKGLCVCLEGDGSLMMNLQELQTLVHYQLPVKLFLYSNGEYSSIRQTQDHFFNLRHTGCDAQSGVSFPNWKNVVEAFGLPYQRIDSHDGLERNIRVALEKPGPVFCEVVLTPGYLFLPKLSSRCLPDGQLVSPSLEDMYPFLPTTELRENIYEES